ncbi:MAG TPA: hypothetical protein DEP05_00375 [Betaproteobacteria bacterium]|nr:hypothetical protein [Betaproteobacteria bacterium]
MDDYTFTFPSPVSRLFSLLPQYPPSFAFAKTLNVALGRIIPLASLEPLHGKLICLHVSDAGLRFHFTIDRRGFVPRTASAVPDLAIRATAYDFLMLALRKEDPDTLFFNRRLIVEGDTELGLLAKNTLDSLDLPRLELAALTPARLARRLRPHWL